MTEPLAEARAQLDLEFSRRGAQTILSRRLFGWPYVLTRTFALDRAPAHMLTIILQTSSGAVHGEDRLLQRLHVGRDAAAHVTTQGASAVHRADPGQTSREAATLRVEAGGCLEYLPEPRILFPDAALEQSIEIDCAPQGVALVSDAFTLHDPTAGGRLFRRYASTIVLRCGSPDPVSIDRMDIAGLGHGRTAAFRAFGSVLLGAPGAGGLDELADSLSGALAAVPGLYGAASLLPGQATGLGVRLAGRDLRAVRAGIHAVWTGARQHLYGAPPPPRRKSDEAPEG